MAKDEFDLKNLPIEAQDESIDASDFTLVDSSTRVHEQKFQTKPTTFFKDSLKRFAKNKSSVVAAGILGVLLLMAVFVPILDPYPVTCENASHMTYLEPKLFKSGTGFWDGTKKWKKIPTDIPTLDDGSLDMNKDNWWPNTAKFHKRAVTNKEFTDFTYINDLSEFGHSGYVEFGYNHKTSEEETIFYRTVPLKQQITLSDTIYLNNFQTYDLAKLEAEEGENASLPENYEIGEIGLYFCYKDNEEGYCVLDEKKVFNIGTTEEKVNLTEALQTALTTAEDNTTEFLSPYFEIRIKNEGERKNRCALIKSLEFNVTNNETLNTALSVVNFTDATENMLRHAKDDDNMTNPACWESNGIKKIHMSKIVYCSFSYDSYEAAFGVEDRYAFDEVTLKKYKKNKWIDYNGTSVKVDNPNYDPTDPDSLEQIYTVVGANWKILDAENSPVEDFISITCDEQTGTMYYNVKLSLYKFYGYSKMPKFLMGTDKEGNVMFRYVFEGLLTSLLLGIGTFVVCFLFGLIYGSIAGYFGGTVDLIMERFTDILSGVPWIVVMTLAIIKFGSNIWTFALALCLTGWIGTAATTRTQFYRFRSREYILASRTLGAKDGRLIAKHILPNAMGTIITSAVLMIPSVIFSEASISYLGLGLKDQSSLGVILSNNQQELTSSSYLLIFPSIVIALLMISFNLFGNGLRDAVNPSLKGED